MMDILPPALVAAQNALAALPIIESGSKAETEALVLSRANYDVTHSPLSCASSIAEQVPRACGGAILFMKHRRKRLIGALIPTDACVNFLVLL